MSIGRVEHTSGVILSMGTTNSVGGAPFHAHSGAGKAGVHNLMQTVANEWADHTIRDTVAPGIVETEGVATAVGGEPPPSMLETVPAGRFGTTADCVPLPLFLASPAAAYVTGGYVLVDGGHSLQTVPY